MTRLDVRLDDLDEPVGKLISSAEGALTFQYEPIALETGKAISLSLPLQEEAHGDVVTRAFFDNLLPENDQLLQRITREGLDRGDLVGILRLVGADCSGALSCLPEGAEPIKIPGDLETDYERLHEDELAEIVRRLASREPLPDDIRDRSPVAGVQSKLALTILPDGQYALPKDDRRVPSTHILKVPRRREAAEAIQEEAATRLAEACGFAASKSRHNVIDDHDVLLIERFDRMIIEGRVYRVHQEDFAQALGLPALLKYERRGQEGRRFDAPAAASVLLQLNAPASARQTFLLSCFFNLAIGNTDNHAKNHAILYEPGGNRTLTPLYDLLPVAIEGNYTDELAFKIGQANTAADLTRPDFDVLLRQFGLRAAAARRFIEGPVRRMLEDLERASAALGPLRLRKFDSLIGHQLALLSDLLKLDLPLRERDAFVVKGGGWSLS